MSSVLGHSLTGLAVYELVKEKAGLPKGVGGAGLAVLLSVASDLDVFAGFIAPEMIQHRGPTHSLLFGLGLSLTFAFIVSKRCFSRFLKATAGLTLVCFSHLALDYLMGRGIGLPLFWPWSDKVYLGPAAIVPTAYYSSSWRGLLGLVHHSPTQTGMLWELILFGPLYPAAWLAGRKIDQKVKFLVLTLLLGVSLAGFVAFWTGYSLAF